MLARGLTAALVSCAVVVSIVYAQGASAPGPAAAAPDVKLQEPSRDASRVYARAKGSLFQVRVLTASGRSQATAGSGFVVSNDGLAITNYHVVSKLVLDPNRYVAEAISASGERDDISVLKIDVLHDLALIRVAKRRDWPPLKISSKMLRQGERLYSLGNPLDLGFAISEGAFNGQITRPYYPQILFSGAINSGMSGGPSVDESGEVIGVNVSKRLDGEQISFLVPAQYVAALVQQGSAVTAQPSQQAFRSEIGRQLTTHQSMMADQLLKAPLATRALGPYAAPINEMQGIRCWGDDPSMPQLKYHYARLHCQNESVVGVEDALRTGFINVRHEYFATEQLDSFRFLQIYAKSYKNESFGSYRDRHRTGPECTDAFVKGDGANSVPVRAVVCVRAMRKFEGLYDFSLMAATVDDSHSGLHTRMDASGVTLENGQRITKAFLDAIGRRP
ncbi:MAG: trypsin-like peptidase domain-containing protein [Burkholderiaceae bacterium]|nr:trypsin-like peptidase domain-containing protein [Burkholderiaceae bacterium]